MSSKSKAKCHKYQASQFAVGKTVTSEVKSKRSVKQSKSPVLTAESVQEAKDPFQGQEILVVKTTDLPKLLNSVTLPSSSEDSEPDQVEVNSDDESTPMDKIRMAAKTSRTNST